MGRARSYEIITTRRTIIDNLITYEPITKLLGINPELDLDSDSIAEQLLWKRIFPHEFIPETTTKTERFINFEVKSVADPRNRTLKNITIMFFISCHQDVVKLYSDDPFTDLWYDKVVCELEELFCNPDIINPNENKSEMGLAGTLEVIDNVPYYPQQKFKGRLLTFKMKDFADGKKNGK